VNAAAALKKGVVAKSAVVGAAASGAAAKAQTDPGIISQLFGSDSPILTAMAVITSAAAVFVTIGVIYLTIVQFQDDQLIKNLSDPSSKEFQKLQDERRRLEMVEKGRGKGGKMTSKAISELASMSEAKKPKPNIPSEPGNRDARRNAAKRRRQEEKMMAKKISEDSS